MEKTIKLQYIIAWDLIIVVMLYMVPTISHLTALPLYKFEPMRWVLLLTLLITGEKKNSFFLAATLPLFSFAVGHHPIFIKCILLTIELVANVFLFDYMFKFIRNSAVSMFLAIIFSKILYYFIKILCISTGLLEGQLFATSIWIQIIVVLIITLLFHNYEDKKVALQKKLY